MSKSFWDRLKQRMRTWERSPFTYEFKDEEVHHCLNCFHDFKGNYCPYCSQSADTKRISWKSIFGSFLELWDFTTRSVPSTLWQLTYRPGHLIRDYLQGRRLTSFAPIKMLLVVAFFISLIDYYFIKEEEKGESKTEVTEEKAGVSVESSLPPQAISMTGVEATVEDSLLAEAAQQRQAEESADSIKEDFESSFGNFFEQKMEGYDAWSEENQGWSMLMLISFLIPPTWLLFRRSKRFPKHTLPEGFYIQVLMCPFMLIISLLIEVSGAFTMLIPVYYVYAYRQLFGYSTWGTVWRLLLCLLFTVVLFFLIIVVAAVVWVIWSET